MCGRSSGGASIGPLPVNTSLMSRPVPLAERLHVVAKQRRALAAFAPAGIQQIRTGQPVSHRKGFRVGFERIDAHADDASISRTEC